MTLHGLARAGRWENEPRRQTLYPVVDDARRLVGVITRKTLRHLLQSGSGSDRPLGELAQHTPVVAHADEPLRVVVNRMAETGLTRFPVIEQKDKKILVGMVSLADLLRARTRSIEEERKRERVLRIRLPFGARGSVVEKD
jgi:CBS domain-containing protein